MYELNNPTLMNINTDFGMFMTPSWFHLKSNKEMGTVAQNRWHSEFSQVGFVCCVANSAVKSVLLKSRSWCRLEQDLLPSGPPKLGGQQPISWLQNGVNIYTLPFDWGNDNICHLTSGYPVKGCRV